MRLSNQAAIHVQLNGVHLCCLGCVDAVATALKRVKGIAHQCDIDNKTVTFTARDNSAAQAALAAIAAAGFHGETGNEQLAMKADSNVPRGKVRRVTVSGIHNCCQPCYEAIEGAIRTVMGVTSDTAQPGKTTFDVMGGFDAAALIRALNAAGFSAQVK